jgi:hypothetical protein
MAKHGCAANRPDVALCPADRNQVRNPSVSSPVTPEATEPTAPRLHPQVLRPIDNMAASSRAATFHIDLIGYRKANSSHHQITFSIRHRYYATLYRDILLGSKDMRSRSSNCPPIFRGPELSDAKNHTHLAMEI